MLNNFLDDCFVFTIPGKFPEAYYKTIDELLRRKAQNQAIKEVCKLFQSCIKSERKLREQFNKKYGEYLPVSIQGDLAKQPFDILFCQEECLTAANYQFIDKVEVKR